MDEKSDYNDDAQINRDYESLTDKQRAVVNAVVATEGNGRRVDIAERANVDESYVDYVRENFPHIIDNRLNTMQAKPDGGTMAYTVRLTDDEVWRAIRLLPDSLSETIFEQVRSNDR